MEEDLYRRACSIENLISAWEKIKEKGSAGGIDRVTIETFEAGLDKNLKELLKKRWICEKNGLKRDNLHLHRNLLEIRRGMLYELYL